MKPTQPRRLSSSLLSTLVALVAAVAVNMSRTHAQQLDPNFAFPFLWERFTEYTSAQGPYRSTLDGRGGIFVVGNGAADVVNGAWRREPIRLLEASGTEDAAFRSAVTGGFALAIQPDGKILISSSSDGADVVFRLTASGALDPAFVPVGFTQNIRHLAVLPDGGILVVVWGNIFANPGPGAVATPEPTAVRLHANGQLDDSFRRPQFSASPNNLFAPPVIDTAGRILLGGAFTTVNGVDRVNLVRLLASGEVDESFVGSASVPGGLGGTVRHLAIQSDGHVVVVGDMRVPAAAPRSSQIAALRFDANGQFDSGFATNLVSGLGLSDYPRALALCPDDKFVTVSSGLRRFNADGTVDPVFVPADFPASAYWVSRLSDGRLLVPGGDPAEGLSAFTPDGAPDLSFRTGGFGRSLPPTSYAFLANGRIAVGGQFNRVGPQPQLGLALLSAETGQALPPQPDLASQVPQGVMSGLPGVAKVAPGQSNTFWFLAGVRDTNAADHVLFGRVLGDGTLDPAVPVTDRRSGDDLVALADGRLWLTDNSCQAAVEGQSPLQRLLSDGTADPAFPGLDSRLRSGLAGVSWNADDTLRTIEVGRLRLLTPLGSGSFLASVSTVDGQARLVRIGGDGQMDDSFSSLAITGLATRQNFVMVYNPRTGTYEMPTDGAFVSDEQVFTDAAELPNGQLLVCGRSGGLGAGAGAHLARLNPDGQVDATFPNLQLEYRQDPFWTARLNSVEVDAQGRIYVAGLFDHINTVPAPGLARLLPGGGVDDAFHSPVTVTPYPTPVADLKLVGSYLYVFGNWQQDNTQRLGWRLRIEAELRLTWRPTTSPGGLELTVPGDSTRPTVLQASDDLAAWVGVFTNTPGAGATNFVDPEAGMKPHRFYRLSQ